MYLYGIRLRLYATFPYLFMFIIVIFCLLGKEPSSLLNLNQSVACLLQYLAVWVFLFLTKNQSHIQVKPDQYQRGTL